MLNYIFQTIMFQIFFIIIYDLLLKKETFFSWNRAYLLLTVSLSVLLPFIKIESFKNIVSQEYIINLPTIFLGKQTPKDISSLGFDRVEIPAGFNISIETIIYIGCAISLLIFVFKISRLSKLIFENYRERKQGILLVKLPNSKDAFSFLNYVFIGDKINSEDIKTIIEHETIHIKQKHTLDLLFFELFRILFWFNPIIYIFQNRINTLHEFIADSGAIKNQDKTSYYQNLLTQVFETQKVSFINSFYKQSLIKKRIIMLNKSKSKQTQLLKYALLLPMVFCMLLYTSCEQDKNEQPNTTAVNAEQSSSLLVQKINAVQEQIQVQGHANQVEEKGLNILLQAVSNTEFNPELVNELQAYSNITNKGPLSTKILEVLNQIQAQGNISSEEEKALKMLLILTTENGLNNPSLADAVEYVDIPFGLIENVPEHPNCKNLNSNEEKKKCMAENISLHVQEHFNTNIGKEDGLTGRQRINVIFKVNTKGNIVGVRARAPHPDLEAEAIRVIQLLPQFKPGTQSGVAVNVPYSLPIVFEIKE